MTISVSGMSKATDWFYRLFGVALLTRVVEDQFNGRWSIHSGEMFPWRHMPAFPLVPTSGLVLEWVVLAVCGVGLVSGRWRILWARVAFVALFLSLAQMFQNQKLLLWFISGALSLAPPLPGGPVRWVLRWQLIVVYGFTAIHKLLQNFHDGDVIRGVATYLLEAGASGPRRLLLEGLSVPLISQFASVGALALELAIPLFLMTRPKVGLVCVIALHVSFSLAMPDLFAFGFAMTSLAFLFVDRVETR